jgi:ABC-type multidrug transport system fused ATPase/permease subunit
MVLAQGRVVEMGQPHVLSADPTSVFHEMTSNAAVAKAMLD